MIKKKLMSVIASVAMLASSAVIPVHAHQSVSLQELEQEAKQLVDSGNTDEALQKLNVELNQMALEAASNEESNTYAHFDDYSGTLFLLPHYVVAATRQMGTCSIYFYLTPNAFEDYSSYNHFSACEGFSFRLSAPTVVNSQTSRIAVNVTGSKSSGEYFPVFKYKMDITSIVRSKMDLFLYTSLSPDGENTMTASNAKYNCKKCIYALGDVDRDGKITLSDSLQVLQETNGLLKTASGRSGEPDRLTFRLAADVNQDGEVTMDDVDMINKVVTGQIILS